MELVNALLIEPGRAPLYILLENSRKCVEGIIEGEIKTVKPWKDNIVAIYARPGATPKPPNRIIAKDNEVLFPVAQVFGSLLLCAVNDPTQKITDGAFCPLSKDQILKYCFRFAIPDEIRRDTKTGYLNWKVHYQAIIENSDESEELF